MTEMGIPCIEKMGKNHFFYFFLEKIISLV